jgi:hypothetical protein
MSDTDIIEHDYINEDLLTLNPFNNSSNENTLKEMNKIKKKNNYK